MFSLPQTLPSRRHLYSRAGCEDFCPDLCLKWGSRCGEHLWSITTEMPSARLSWLPMPGCHVYGLCSITVSILPKGSPVILPTLQLQFNSPWATEGGFIWELAADLDGVSHRKEGSWGLGDIIQNYLQLAFLGLWSLIIAEHRGKSTALRRWKCRRDDQTQ